MSAIASTNEAPEILRSWGRRGESMQDLPDDMGEAKILTDVAGRIQYLNRTAERMLGISFEQTRGRPLSIRGLPCQRFFELKGESKYPSIEALVADCLTHDETVYLGNSARLVNRAVGEVPVGGSITPMRVEGHGLVGTIMSLRDVTATRHLTNQVFKLNGIASD